MPIATVADLHEHIALAMRVEMTTIPPYLYAMYSIGDRRSEAARLIRSVVVEEMLHAALMANLAVATGGEPRFYRRENVPVYPGLLPHHIPELMLHLAPCSPELVRAVFMTIERPSEHGAPDEPDEFETLGQFYHALESALRDLDQAGPLFVPTPGLRQLGPRDYGPVEFDDEDSGGLVIIGDLDSALEAIEIVVHQGEGVGSHRFADESHQELTHFYKFEMIADGATPLGDIKSLVSDPASAEMPAPVRPVAEFANALYCYLLVLLDRLYRLDGDADHGARVGEFYTVMNTALGPVCRYLTDLEIGEGRTAGPPFEWYDFADPAAAEEELASLGHSLTEQHPKLAGLVGRLPRSAG